MKKVSLSQLQEKQIALIGMPFDDYSSFLKGAGQAPALIWDTITTGSLNKTTELGVDLKEADVIRYLGDVSWQSTEQAFANLEQCIEKVFDVGAKPLVLGGDHSITYPILKSCAKHHRDITILHFDAHPDLYDSFKDNPLSHACPFARIMENKLASCLVQIGIRTMNAHQREQADKFGVEVHEMKDWSGSLDRDPAGLNLEGPIYISIDIDALDPAFAPGVSHQEPGGLSVRQILDVIHSINAPVIGADIVEYNPDRDINGMTAVVAAKLFKEVAGKMV